MYHSGVTHLQGGDFGFLGDCAVVLLSSTGLLLPEVLDVGVARHFEVVVV